MSCFSFAYVTSAPQRTEVRVIVSPSLPWPRTRLPARLYLQLPPSLPTTTTIHVFHTPRLLHPPAHQCLLHARAQHRFGRRRPLARWTSRQGAQAAANHLLYVLSLGLRSIPSSLETQPFPFHKKLTRWCMRARTVLNKLILASLAVSAFYIWCDFPSLSSLTRPPVLTPPRMNPRRLSIQSTAAGGWWNLLTGHHPAEKTVAEVCPLSLRIFSPPLSLSPPFLSTTADSLRLCGMGAAGRLLQSLRRLCCSDGRSGRRAGAAPWCRRRAGYRAADLAAGGFPWGEVSGPTDSLSVFLSWRGRTSGA